MLREAIRDWNSIELRPTCFIQLGDAFDGYITSEIYGKGKNYIVIMYAQDLGWSRFHRSVI